MIAKLSKICVSSIFSDHLKALGSCKNIVRVCVCALVYSLTTLHSYSNENAHNSFESGLSNTVEFNQDIFNMPDWSKERATFLRTERVLWQMDNEELAAVLQDLNGYPLSPYLIKRKLSHGMRLSDKPLIEAFLQQFGQTPFAEKLRADWLEYLAKRNKAQEFIKFYKPSRNPKLACTFIEYEISVGIEPEKLFSEIEALWTVGKSQPKECDNIFKTWMDAGQLTDDIVLARIEKAADGGKHTLIPYLKTLLSDDKKYLADLWHSTRRNPSFVQNIDQFTGRFPTIETAVMTYGLSRLIWRDQDLALRVFKEAENTMAFTDQHKARIYGRFGIKLAIDDHKLAEGYLLEASNYGNDDEVTRWHLAYLLRNQQWAKIVLLVENLKPQSVAGNAYPYWLARAYEKLGKSDEAEVLYKQLSQHRHYYGFLASARLKQPFHLENQPVQVDIQLVHDIVSMDSSKRAHELKQLGRLHEARLEWRYTQQQLDDSGKLASSIVASAWNWPDQAIFTFTREGYMDDVKLRFPVAYEDVITREAERNRIEPEWAFAIVRRESSFMTDAVSSANARGLMQVLPSTAKYLERRRVSARQLLDIETNAKIGNKYLRYLMDKLDNNTVLATASYNAGWRRVKQWLPENEALEADIWVELIPFRETRNYVKAVMAYKQIYHAKLVDKIDFNSQFALAPSTVFSEFIETNIPVAL